MQFVGNAFTNVNHLLTKGNRMSKHLSLMTPSAARRIQSAEAKAGDGTIKKGGFAAKALRTAAKNKAEGKVK